MALIFLNVAGLSNSGDSHWQTVWEKENPEMIKRVEQDDWNTPLKQDWIIRLNEVVEQQKDDIVLIAHSLGCLTVAHWASVFSSNKIKAGLLVAPPDADRTDEFAIIDTFSPVPTQRLPFPSVVVASTNDEYATIERSLEMATHWGSNFINIGQLGHINANSNLGGWKEGVQLLKQLLNEVNLKSDMLF